MITLVFDPSDDSVDDATVADLALHSSSSSIFIIMVNFRNLYFDIKIYFYYLFACSPVYLVLY